MKTTKMTAVMMRSVVKGALAAMLLLGGGGCPGFCGGAPDPNQAEASIYLTDSTTGAAIKSPTFTENTTPIGATCQDPSAQDSSLCTSELIFVTSTVHQITVSAPGYQDTTFTVDASASNDVHLAVAMTPLGFCGANPGGTEVSLYLTDASTGKPVEAPTFAEGSTALTSSCQQPVSGDLLACTSQLIALSSAVHQITISAPGYQSTTVTVDTTASADVHLAVALDRLAD